MPVQPQRDPRPAATQLMTVAFHQLKALKFQLLAVGAPALTLLLILLLVSKSADIPISTFTRDPTAVLQGKFYVGLLSNTGIVLWSAAAAICIFSAVLAGGDLHGRRLRLFLLASGLFTLLLLMDDLFLFHEEIAPHFLNVRERYVLLSYGLIMAAYLVKFWRTILETDFSLLFVAGGCFMLSVFIDKNSFAALPDPYLLEDGAKFSGIAFWLLYLSRTALQAHRVGSGEPGRTEGLAPAKGTRLPKSAPEV